MEDTDKINADEKDLRPHFAHRDSRGGKIFGGLIILSAGALLFARQLGTPIPEWIFTWPVLLIVIGLYIGVKHSFRHFGWLFPFLIGSFFLADKLILNFSMAQYIWPVAIMVVGLIIILKPKRKFQHKKWHRKWEKYNASFPDQASHWEKHYSDYKVPVTHDDFIDSVSVFGGVKKNIISKDFKGGEVTNLFGGAEINLMQADINGRVVLEITQVFGGTVLIVPSHWELQMEELVAVMGSIDDKRQIQANRVIDENKKLVLRGTTVFGGIEIKSF